MAYFVRNISAKIY